MIDRLLNDFYQKLAYERVNNNSRYEKDIKGLYKVLLKNLVISYNEYNNHISGFLHCLEDNNPHSVSYSIELFFELLNKIIAGKKFSAFDYSIIDQEYNDATLTNLKKIYNSGFSKDNRQRLSDGNFDISSLSDKDKMEMSSLIIDRLQEDSKNMNWDKDKVELTMMNLPFLRQILFSLGKPKIFYYVIGIFIDRLSTSEFFQASRDIGEEIIISAYKDGIPEYGYLNSFRAYSNIGSIHAALLYANLSMSCVLQKEPPYSDLYVKEIIWLGMKLFRNVGIFDLTIKLYTSIPVELKYDNYDRQSVDQTYFSTLLMMYESDFPVKLLDYLNRERESIISGGIHSVQPWLLTLYNVKRIYADADFTQTGLGFYLNVFETIVPFEIIKKQKDIIEGVADSLKIHLKESLIKLNETRNLTDFIYDNESALRLSKRIIGNCLRDKDMGAYLMSMMIKSDYSILFKQKASIGIGPLILPEIDINSLETLYDDQEKLIDSLNVIEGSSISWLAASEGKLYQLQLFNREYNITLIDKWMYNSFKELVESDFFSSLKFSDTKKDKNGVRLLSPEEYKQEEDEIASELEITSLNISVESKELLVVKDMEISLFPHNLFLNQDGEFIAKSIPVTNILSTEWFIQTANAKPLSNDYSKSIWIPIENGDMPLNYLYSKLEAVLQEHHFDVFNQIEIPKPLSSDINIICSHGAKNISEVQVVFQENNPTYNLDSVIGNGKILIFFVCHSGSMKQEFFRNNVTSLVKRFISQGYDAVIAPFWALDVTIPGIWLPEFLDSMNKGLTISQATFNANKKVYDTYPTPSAWACLHLYGNPHIRIV